MIEILVWPPPWLLTTLVGIIILIVGWGIAARQVTLRNRKLEALRAVLSDSGIEANPNSFSVSGKDVSVLISGDHLAFVDLDEPRLIRTYSLFQVESLKIYDDTDHNAIDFHISLLGGARSRRIPATSMAEFCRLFDYFQQAEKNIQFIAE